MIIQAKEEFIGHVNSTNARNNLDHSSNKFLKKCLFLHQNSFLWPKEGVFRSLAGFDSSHNKTANRQNCFTKLSRCSINAQLGNHSVGLSFKRSSLDNSIEANVRHHDNLLSPTPCSFSVTVGDCRHLCGE